MLRVTVLRFCVLAMPLLLTGCGDGWEAQRTTDIFPYGNKRTAGSGVVYVRAKMLPEKEIVAEPKMEEKTEIKPADEVFTRAQVKGGPKPAARDAEPVEKLEDKPAEKAQAEPVKDKETAKPAQEKAAVAPAAGLVPPPPNAVSPAAAKPAGKKTYEQMLDEGARRDTPPSVPAGIEPKAGEVATPGKQSNLMRPPESSSLEIVQIPEEVQIDSRTNKAVMPVNEIRSPMQDVYDRDYEAEKSLEEIYANPF